MATVLSNMEPAENWDDDFEFQGQGQQNTQNTDGSRNKKNRNKNKSPPHTPDPRRTRNPSSPSSPSKPRISMSTTSSQVTMEAEDWDLETPAHTPVHSRNPSHSYSNQQPQHQQQTRTWSEAGPSTPTRRLVSSGSGSRRETETTTTENWDEDFEDRVDSPPRSPRSPGSPRGKKREDGKERRKSSTTTTTTRKTTTTENWDDEFQFGDSPARSMRNRHPQYSVHQHSFNEEEDSDDDDEADFNFHGSDKDEDDRTVTARSRRAALSRLVSNSSSSPPPPVPPLPFSLLPIPPQHSASSDHEHEHVFPHSPTTSVFSVPTSHSGGTDRDRDSIAAPSHYSYGSYNSTTYLRPTVSRSSAGGGGLSHLPPSPPIHKDRERRRLRKKSRPQEPQGPALSTAMNTMKSMNVSREGMVHMMVNSSRESIGNTGVNGRPVTPLSLRSMRSLSPPAIGTTSTTSNRNSVMSASDDGNTSSGLGHSQLNVESGLPSLPNLPNLPSSPPPHQSLSQAQATPAQKTPLLTRIGSVKKKWAVRKKRASSAPSEVEVEGTGFGMEEDQHQQQQPSSSRANWFFRATSGNGSTNSNSKIMENEYITNINPLDIRPSMPSTPATPTTPSKLMKRKSFGFVQLRPRNKPINDVDTGNVVEARDHVPPPPPRNPNRPKKHSINPSSSGGGHAGSSTSDLPSDLEAELHLRAGLGGGSLSSSSGDLHVGETGIRPSQSRHASYGGLGLGRAPQGSSENLDRDGAGDGKSRSRRRSFSKSSAMSSHSGSQIRKRSKSRETKRGTLREDSAVQESRESKEAGSRSFMGSVRRISFIGSSRKQGNGDQVNQEKQHQHKRTKSGVSLASLASVAIGDSGGAIRKSFDIDLHSHDEDDDPRPPPMPHPNLSQNQPTQALLPPIELLPPSPPQRESRDPTKSTATTTANNNPALANTTTNHFNSHTKPAPVSPVSPLTASLGRSTVAPSIGGKTIGGVSSGISNLTSSTSMPATSASSNVPRRNSLGDMRNSSPGNMQNSLGGLKIPARISQAQVGLKRDLGMVKEFAGRVEQLKTLQTTYHNLVAEVQGILDAQHAVAHAAQSQHVQYAPRPVSRPASPSPLGPSALSPSATSAPSPLGPSSTSPSLPSSPSSPSSKNIFRPISRIRSNTASTVLPSSYIEASSSSSSLASQSSPSAYIGTLDPTSSRHHEDTSNVNTDRVDSYKHLAAAFYTINSRYKIAWECAELLIELGGGPVGENGSSGGGSGDGNVGGKSGAESVPNSPPPHGNGGAGFPGSQGQGHPSTSISAPVALAFGTSQLVPGSQAKKSRERAITLSGDEASSKPGTPTPGIGMGERNYTGSYSSSTYITYSSTATSAPSMTTHITTHAIASTVPTPNMAWRASTGRHDLNQRQLLLLREMLNNEGGSGFVSGGEGFSGGTMQPGGGTVHPSQLGQYPRLDDTHHPNYHSSYQNSPEHSQHSSPVVTTPPALPASATYTHTPHTHPPHTYTHPTHTHTHPTHTHTHTHPSVPALEEEQQVNREWRWGDGNHGMNNTNNSTITLPSAPSEESSSVPSSGFGLGGARRVRGIGEGSGDAVNKKRKSSRLRGMSGLRDMLRSLTRSQNQSVPSTMNGMGAVPNGMAPPSTTSFSTESSSVDHHNPYYQHRYPHGIVPGSSHPLGLGAGAGPAQGPGGIGSAYTTSGRRRAKTSSGPDATSSVRERDQEKDKDGRSTSPYMRSTSPYTTSSLSVKASPRRPSLASIFRIGGRDGREVKEMRDGKAPPLSATSSTMPSAAALGSASSTSPSLSVPSPVSPNNAHKRESTGKTSGTSGSDEEDWDRLEEYPDGINTHHAHNHASNYSSNTSTTMRGRSPYTHHDGSLPPVPPLPTNALQASGSQTSLSLGLGLSGTSVGVPGVPARATRLSNVEENEHPEYPSDFQNDQADNHRESKTSLLNRTRSGSGTSSPVQSAQSRTITWGNKNLTGSVRSMPPQMPQALAPDSDALTTSRSRFSYNPQISHNSEGVSQILSGASTQQHTKLAMTPENIKPLLENANEVCARLGECIGEIRGLVGGLV
ncbi:MAG: hypothetical protein NXY57DRAFT_6642 [Lentinula lateritia]|nr:MAG: hypothetical protein NXY57DRAFT_6642 [Lentinula lateritia]